MPGLRPDTKIILSKNMDKVNALDLSVIILSYKSKTDLERLLPSIFASKNINFTPHPNPLHFDHELRAEWPQGKREYEAEVIVVDNGSNDGTLEWLKQLQDSKFKDLQIIKNQNTGFSAGNNIGIKASGGKYVLLLNPDTRVETDTFEVMLNFMESHQNVGISGCKVLKPDGNLDLACRRKFPNPWNSFKRLFLLSNSEYNLTKADINQDMEIDSVMGAFLLIRRTVIDKIGLLDENFFMYGEDLDWCLRCKEAGYKVWYFPKTSITHFKGSSSSKIPFKALLWFHEAMWIFYKKHYAKKYIFLFNWLVFLGIYLRLILLLFINFFKSKPSVSK